VTVGILILTSCINQREVRSTLFMIGGELAARDLASPDLIVDAAA